MALKKIFSGKYLVPAIHILLWGLYIISPYLFRNPSTWKGFNMWHYRTMFNNALYAGIFYFNAYYLYPVLYKRRKQLWLYVLSLVVLVISVMFLLRKIDDVIFPQPQRFRTMQVVEARPLTGQRITLDKHADSGRVAHGRIERRDFGPGGPRGPHGDFGGDRRNRLIFWCIFNIIPYIFILGISISYRIIIDNAKQEKIRKEKENENLKTELSFLRSQVSPHFIFNILNNMVALARKKSDMLEPSLIELSKLMRYMLYENDDERVSLGREVDYLKSYIALQLLRFGDDVTIMFNPPDNINAYYIEPMLLAPFVENAFKHGVGMVEDPQINITLSVDDATGWMDFKVMNTVAPQQHTKDKDSGIGLVNVRRRLELLYKEDYNLDIMQNDNIFIAALKIKLK
ncbi:histidine kinase [Mucilaginibacter mali]|uniref:Histidine kinase n=1 Tax=Mucilaginibacter mali TaxID=2740462 RepID=A0A7D4PVC1_9SPHI|nr:histidine kinase [Mucilaginibacter mali]QKJ30923.1 histidine kinase [Mucilaginibacter mali]